LSKIQIFSEGAIKVLFTSKKVKWVTLDPYFVSKNIKMSLDPSEIYNKTTAETNSDARKITSKIENGKFPPQSAKFCVWDFSGSNFATEKRVKN